ncbi:MAG TPA: dihydroorotase [Bacteroidetes bacterium]|nr:dihydroorotase [Bacteroidota bacterium]
MTQETTPNLLIIGGTILDTEKGTERKADILIQNGLIADIGNGLDAAGAETYDASGKFISMGWMDMHVHLREPGQEHKETIETGCNAAAFGGFTAVACMPNTTPPIHTRDVVEFIIERASSTPVDVYPIACVSKNREGESLAEMADLAAGGAVAFSDDGSPVQDTGLMRHALEYGAMLGMPIINHEEDLPLGPKGHMHEGEVSTRLGLTGIPGLSEEIMIARDILLAEFTGGHVHVAHISTAKGVDMVREAKAKGIPVTTEVCPHHFTLTDKEVETSGFDTHTKMHPPLRPQYDIDGLKAGLADGTIDAICTDHAPHASFEKEVEYISAPFGILGLETAWGLTGREVIADGTLTTAQAVHKMTITPRDIMHIDLPRIEKGALANLTIFDADTEWVFEKDDIKSKSVNTPFVGSKMKGRAWAIYNKGQLVKNA